MKPLVLDKLQWPTLLDLLAGYTQTTAGKDHCLELKPNLSRDDIELGWNQIVPLKNLIRTGYVPPIGDIPVLTSTFRGASLGQTLDGESLREVYGLLQTVKSVQRFTTDFAEKCSTLVKFDRTIYPLPHLATAIETAISPEGEILDSASPELLSIRRKKLSLRKTIETEIKGLLSDHEVENYLQDKFFTVRSERYVVPIRLDGRGRVKGSIQDTSDSGQTLYIEPEAIKPHNEHLLELELNEKLEILRIFRELSAQVAADLDTLKANYEALVELDILSAKARLAANLDCCAVTIHDQPCLKLKGARHPLVTTPNGGKAIGNHIELNSENHILIVSGPNAGGKTIVLKTVGILHLMAKAGLLIPVEEESEIFLPEEIYLEMGDSQNIEANLSTFSGHVLGLKPILEQAGPRDLVLLDELAVGTEPQTGSAIGQAVLECVADRKALGVVTTHFDNLKGLAMSDPRFRNGSMEFSVETLKPTYKLVLDIPGQSHGLEVAEQMGLPAHVIARAKDLRGESSTEMDRIIEDMLAAKEQAKQERAKFEQLRMETESQKFRWEQDREALLKAKEKASEKIRNVYQNQIDKLKIEFRDQADQFKKLVKKLPSGDQLTELKDEARDSRRSAENKLSALESNLQKLGDEYKLKQDIPGEPVAIDQLKVGSKVYVVSFEREATVTKVQKSPPAVEVSVGLLKIKPALQELRLIKNSKDTKPAKKRSTSANKTQKIGFIVPSPTNSIDLRGQDVERALEKTWAFIDKAVLRGETQLILIHGHGTDVLKRSIRTALTKDSPYNLDFRPGEKEEGGDGVTVVQLIL
ncbi:endonuclease MutS2 [Pseudobacteriovorax antillogorgiicola]|uniref:Endonuclease MutS2 n=1 Tax=Pseudobacteriovorax antillogorgiicola TaxID=1513793 RepID=A0A1Y6B781_9BACT|nr:Smr/MutS family protein [Pseudobacteriovorax antillogorgiicola]TCS58638.1 DNA mismatch repair protein MutS2 [Pseudobacteriovorax antillogorgiicola]SME96540.1 DNA mismatch repair protein MutS2 [Pseudobacteriovorax antillogorgiicola]